MPQSLVCSKENRGESSGVKKLPEMKQHRKTLQVLQQSAKDDNMLIGRDGVLQLKVQTEKSGSKVSRKTQVYVDMKGQMHKATQTETADDQQRTEGTDAWELVCSESVPVEYWKQVAEERRAALEDSLTENEELHERIGKLEEENSILRNLAGEAEHLADILKSLTEEELPEEGAEDEDCADRREESEGAREVEEEQGEETLAGRRM